MLDRKAVIYMDPEGQIHTTNLLNRQMVLSILWKIEEGYHYSNICHEENLEEYLDSPPDKTEMANDKWYEYVQSFEKAGLFEIRDFQNKEVDVKIYPHTTIDKRFKVDFPHIYAMIDFDDVDHQRVEASIKVIKQIIEKYWDQKLFDKIYKEEVLKTWNENRYNLQMDWEDEGGLEGYLENHGVKTFDDKSI